MPKGIKKPQDESPKLLILIIGVNQYQDSEIANLNYAANDAKELGEALTVATTLFPQKTIITHYDGIENRATITAVNQSIQQLIANTNDNTTILFYFSGHGFLEPGTQQIYLAVGDTYRKDLRTTGLSVSKLLNDFTNSRAKTIILWLDACHSGGTRLGNLMTRVNIGLSSDKISSELTTVLKKFRSGIYAILSCQEDQESLEFEDLRHGVFTYYLIEGIKGKAADQTGVIEIDKLYQYVHNETLKYIHKINQQIKLSNQQKSQKGSATKPELLTKEYPYQIPQRIIQGAGEIVIGTIRESKNPIIKALLINGISPHPAVIKLSNLLNKSGFNTKYVDKPDNKSIKEILKIFFTFKAKTRLLYLRATIELTASGGLDLIFWKQEKMALSYLYEILNYQILNEDYSEKSPIILILDMPRASAENLNRLYKGLQLDKNKYSQAILAGISTKPNEPDKFIEVLVKLLDEVSNSDLAITGLITMIQRYNYGEKSLDFKSWLSSSHGIIDIIKSGQVANIDPAICPYKGLDAFSKEDMLFFFGRDKLIEQIIAKLTHKSFLTITGKSGSGKSSVVQAGVLPKLETIGLFSSEEQRYQIANTASFRPGMIPIKSLAQALANLENPLNQMERILNSGSDGWVEWIWKQPSELIVLVIDQFEELFTITSDSDRAYFLELIIEAIAKAGDKLKIIITVRSDFFEDCLSLVEFGKLKDWILADHIIVPSQLEESEYRTIIEKPCSLVNLTIEPALVNQLLNDVKSVSIPLPLLELMLTQLYKNRETGKLTIQSYHVMDRLTGVLNKIAQELYDKLTDAQKEAAQYIFIELVTLGEQKEDTRRRLYKTTLLNQLPEKYNQEIVKETLQILINSRLIVETENQLKPVVINQGDSDNNLANLGNEIILEIAHEILIREWGTLRRWLKDNGEKLKKQRQIEQKAFEWEQQKKQSDYLLRGSALAIAEDQYIDYRNELPDLSIQFITASLELRDYERLKEEKQLKQQLAQEKKAKNNAQRAIWVLVVSVLLLTVIGIFANYQRIEAQRQADIATLREQAARVENRLANDPIAALELAINTTGQSQSKLGQVLSEVYDSLFRSWKSNRLKWIISSNQQHLTSIALSPDGNTIATGSGNGTIRLWNNSGKAIGKPLIAHQGSVASIVFSSDGKTIASGGADGKIILWNRSGQAIRKLFSDHQGSVSSIALSPDGNTIVSGHDNGTILLWNRYGEIIGKNLTRYQSSISSVAFSPDGNTIASGGADGVVYLWDKSGKAIADVTDNGHPASIFSVIFSPDGNTIASCGSGEVILWNKLGQVIETISVGHQRQVYSVTFSPDGNTIAIARSDGVWLWSKSGQTIGSPLIGHKEITQVAFSLDGNTIATASENGTIGLWSKSGQVIGLSLTGHRESIRSVVFSPDGNTIASGSWDKTIRLWNISNQAIINILTGHQDGVDSVAFSPDGNTIFSSDRDKTIRLWNKSGQAIGKTLIRNEDMSHLITFSPDGQMIVAASKENYDIIFFNKSGQVIGQTVNGHDWDIQSIAFSPDGNMIATGSRDKTIRLWNKSGKAIGKPLTGHQEIVGSVAFSPDSSIIASGSNDGEIRLWNKSGKAIGPTLTGHQGGVYSIAFSPDGNTIASGGEDGAIHLWDKSGRPIGDTLTGHKTYIVSIAFSPNGNTIASGSNDGEIRLWNIGWQSILKKSCDILRSHLENQPNSEALKTCQTYANSSKPK